jgi:hypothetical protein
VVVLVAVVGVSVAASAILYFEVSHLTTGPGSTPIGTAFATAYPTAETCTASMASNDACVTPGDYVYSLSVVQSVVELDDVIFVVDTPTGAVFVNSNVSGFALVTPSGTACAYSEIPAGAGLAMPGTWSDYVNGCSPLTPLTDSLTIVIDMGQSSSTVGMGLTFVAEGSGSYSGTTPPLGLP